MDARVRLIFTLIVVLLMPKIGYTQLNNTFFYQERDSASIGNLDLYIENLNFFRNTEYKSKTDVGKTLFGFQFSPQISYQAGKHVKVEAGIWLQRDFGNTAFYEVSPIYRLIIEKKRSTFIVGSLFGSNQHGFIEPLYHPEFVINNRNENGLQYLLDANHLKIDAWIDWQKMIYDESPFREEFVMGLCSEWKPLKKEKLQLSFPFQMLILHKGGEIDLSGEGVVSQFNFSYGAKIKQTFTGRKLKSWNLQGYLNYFEEPTTTPETFIDGLGQLVALEFNWEKIGLMVNYWDAHEFQAPFGDVMYQSVSNLNRTLYTFHYRKMAMLRMSYKYKIQEDLNFLLRANALYDLNEGDVNFIAELYLRWTPKFNLGSIARYKSKVN